MIYRVFIKNLIFCLIYNGVLIIYVVRMFWWVFFLKILVVKYVMIFVKLVFINVFDIEEECDVYWKFI